MRLVKQTKIGPVPCRCRATAAANAHDLASQANPVRSVMPDSPSLLTGPGKEIVAVLAAGQKAHAYATHADALGMLFGEGA